MHQVVTKKTWRIEASSDAGDTICGGVSGGMMADMMERKRKKMMKSGAMEGGMGGVQNWRRSLADWKNIDFLGKTMTVVQNEAPGEGKRRRVVISTEVIAGKGQSITAVTTDDESAEANVMDADLHVLRKMHSALFLPEKVLRSRCWEADDEKDEGKKVEKKVEKKEEKKEQKEKEKEKIKSSTSTSSRCESECASSNGKKTGRVSLKKAYLSKCVATRKIKDLSTSTYECYSCFGGILHLLKCVMKAKAKKNEGDEA
ncbi:uncharacterized protein MONOS_14727 [Monocercomonoides exilis]|uniref:uncharacterized protein n=1 Tax=Monocercomonoides exilis TaxID=2049356 RepID=UPI00355A5F73|nr:hypothetical protein MONOS_14727 [Monocercomonoides exilis]|eukprot:MONOS_14727.1-p1 / transcript=MONOS_14727.1 / gene=MONOS_14727 / organism=Monocercomonoides_exilis_PA203 / gene_product=unspecified product / transcript_product=unspecified product / location=Mono_scaffold01060:2723-3597(+) / protein_length=258 / sequence_SO=supercontig / SO=protein_coding / is_pseudo=false